MKRFNNLNSRPRLENSFWARVREAGGSFRSQTAISSSRYGYSSRQKIAVSVSKSSRKPLRPIFKTGSRIAIGLFFSCAFGVLFGVVAHASADDNSLASATTTATTTIITGTGDGSSCTPNPALFAQIKTIQADSTLGYLDEIKAELAVRKQLLAETITCAQNGASALKDSLTALQPSQNFTDLQSKLAAQLDEASAYYAMQLQRVDTAGLSGTQSIARDVLSWRKSNYAPLAENVSNFISWSGNQAFLDVAHDRLQQVKSLVESVPFSENKELQGDLLKAVASLQSAGDNNAKAGQAFVQSLPPDQSLALIQQSLSDLTATYQHFFDISNLTQKLLPH